MVVAVMNYDKGILVIRFEFGSVGWFDKAALGIP
jgi:hypothetical protein